VESKYHKTSAVIQEEWEWILKAKENPYHFSKLYDRYYQPIYLYIYKRTLNKELSGEISSMVFSKALHALPSYTNKGLPFSSWLYKIAQNETAYYFRKHKTTEHIFLEDEQIQALQEETTDDENSIEDYLTKLENILNTIEPTERQLITWRFFEHKSFKEVGDLLRITENNAKVKTYRLLEKLKILLRK
jgi:RNA polymerase sigma-70 factor (ECF subfamily)